MRPHLRLRTHPVADVANVVRGAQHRITVLDAGLVRLEWSDSGRSEDRASQMAVNRAFAPAGHTVAESDTLLEIDTTTCSRHGMYEAKALGKNRLVRHQTQPAESESAAAAAAPAL